MLNILKLYTQNIKTNLRTRHRFNHKKLIMHPSWLSLIDADADNTSNSLLTAEGSADIGVEIPERTLDAGRDDGRVTVDSDEEVTFSILSCIELFQVCPQEASRFYNLRECAALPPTFPFSNSLLCGISSDPSATRLGVCQIIVDIF